MFECMADVFATIMEIRESFKDRAEFYLVEMHKLNFLLDSKIINESQYFRRMCPLLAEKQNINQDYKRKVMSTLQYIPKSFHTDDVLPYCQEDLV